MDQSNSISQSRNSSAHVKTENESEPNHDVSNKMQNYKVSMKNEVKEEIHQKKCLKCTICPFLTKDGQRRTWELRLHMIKIHFICCICEHKSDNKIQGEIHFAKQHQEDKDYLKCNIGGCSFKAKISTHLKNKEINQYRLGSSMNPHIKTVHRGFWFRCDQCHIKKNSACDLKKHKRMHSVLPRPRKKCNICDIQLLVGDSFVNHMKKLHSDQPRLFCSQCKFSTKYIVYLQVHERGHTELLRCSKCDFSCVQKHVLKRHDIFRHKGEEFICSSCDFKTDAIYRLHIHEEQHNERTLKCPHCKYMGKGKYTLKNHMLRHQDPKYICTECDYKTYDAGNFSTHKSTKHGIVVLKCDTCDYNTKSKRSLRQHKEKHHNQRDNVGNV